jgi:hypothetical protein
MPRIRVLILALALGGVCAWLVSCGGSSSAKLIPATNASQLLANLNQVRSYANDGLCSSAANATDTVIGQVNDLGNKIDPKLKQYLLNALEQLKVLANDPVKCTLTTETTATTESTASTSTTVSTATVTTPTTPPPTTTTPSTTTPPPTSTGGGTPGSGGTGGGGTGGGAGTGPPTP